MSQFQESLRTLFDSWNELPKGDEPWGGATDKYDFNALAEAKPLIDAIGEVVAYLERVQNSVTDSSLQEAPSRLQAEVNEHVNRLSQLIRDISTNTAPQPPENQGGARRPRQRPEQYQQKVQEVREIHSQLFTKLRSLLVPNLEDLNAEKERLSSELTELRQSISDARQAREELSQTSNKAAEREETLSPDTKILGLTGYPSPKIPEPLNAPKAIVFGLSHLLIVTILIGLVTVC